jgi:hypothetical protein
MLNDFHKRHLWKFFHVSKIVAGPWWLLLFVVVAPHQNQQLPSPARGTVLKNEYQTETSVVLKNPEVVDVRKTVRFETNVAVTRTSQKPVSYKEALTRSIGRVG